ncbi:MAG TPA: hypothetical protein VF691_20520 [Cytophagaceae bacterium]
MANIPGTIVGDPLSIGDTEANKFGSHYPFMGIGGAYEVFYLHELYAIPVKQEIDLLNTGDLLSSGRRRMGMTIFVISENRYYKLYDPLWHTYTSNSQKYDSLKDDANWRDAFSDIYLPISGGNLTGKLGLPNGTYQLPSIFFTGYPSEGLFYDSDLGLGISSKGKSIYFTSAGIETLGDTALSVGVRSESTSYYSFAFGGYSKATNYISLALGSYSEASGTYSTAIGGSSKAMGSQSTAIGIFASASSFRSTSIGSNLTNDGDSSTVIGVAAESHSAYSILIGANLNAFYGSDFSVLVGNFLYSTQARGIVIGGGISPESPLINNIGNSIYLGTNSTVPSLFIGGGNGLPGTYGNIGVNLTYPTARLDIKEGDSILAPFRIRRNSEDKDILEDGELQYSVARRLEFSPGDGIKEQLAYLSDITGGSSPFLFTGISGNGIKSSQATNKAEGEYSLAMGYGAWAMSLGSVALGIGNKAWGSNSFSAGEGTIAGGITASAFGSNTQAFGDYSHAEGNNTITGHPPRSFTVNGSQVIIEGDVTQQLHSGATLLFYNIIGGTSSGIQGSISNSVYEGITTTFNVSFDLTGISSGLCVNPSFGRYGHAEGISTVVVGQAGHAEGNGSKSEGDYSHAEGFLSTAKGMASHAQGYNTKANGDYSHSEGSLTQSVGTYSHSEGVLTLALGNGSHGEGAYSKANGDYSHAQGVSTIAGGIGSHAEGQNSEAASNYSHAGGADSKAERTGQVTRASGKFSSIGDAQYSRVCMRKQTTNASVTELAVDGVSEKLIMTSGKVWAFTVDIVAKQTGLPGQAQATASFLYRGLIKNNSGTVSLIDLALLTNQREASASSWQVIINANDFNKALRIYVTGEANKTIRWVALVQLTEVG